MIGVINVHHRNSRQHSAEEVALLSYVAEQMGGAIAKTRLSERSEAAVKKVELLAAVGHTISTESYLDRILQVISEMVAETFDAPVCSIMIVDEDKRELSIRAARCSSPEYLQKLPIRIEDQLIGRVVRERQLLTVPDVAGGKLYQYPGAGPAVRPDFTFVGSLTCWSESHRHTQHLHARAPIVYV